MQASLTPHYLNNCQLLNLLELSNLCIKDRDVWYCWFCDRNRAHCEQMGILTVKLLRCIWKTDTFIESLKAGDNVILMAGARAGGSHGKWWVCVCFQPAQGRTLGRRCGPSGGWIPDSVGTAQGLNGGSQDLSSLTRDRNPGPLQWTRRLLTTGPAGISHRYCQHIHCCQ